MNFCFSTFIKLFKKHAKNKQISNAAIVEALFCNSCDALLEKNNLCDKYGNPKALASKLVNRKENVPVKIAKLIVEADFKQLNDGLEDTYDFFLNYYEIDKYVREIKEIVAKDVLLSELIKIQFKVTVYEEYEFLTFSLIECMKVPNKLTMATFHIYSKGRGSLNLIVDDILRIAFEKKISSNRIVVIPVDTKFNMELSNFEDYRKVVSIKTIHGQWIDKMKKRGYTRKRILETIEYQKDTLIPVINVNKTKFYLLPISEFDENNNARSSRLTLENAIVDLLKFYDLHDQGETLYLPLMGTGLSRVGLNHNESLKLIKDTMMKNKEYLNGTINIVVFNDDIEKFEGNEYGIQK